MAITIFTNQTPAVLDVNTFDVAVTLGTQWYSESDGAVHAVRFYLGNRNYDNMQVTGGLYIWDAGTLLAQKNYTITASNPVGYVTITFDSPVIVERNQTYVAAVWLPGSSTTPDGNAHYAYTDGFFASAVDNLPLHAHEDDVIFNHKRNGVYATGDTITYPALTSGSTCYFVDVVFDYITKAKVRTAGSWSSHPIKIRSGGQWRL